MKLLIKNGRLVDPAGAIDRDMDILIENGRFKEIAKSIKKSSGCPTIDATGLIVAPGFVDMHTHLREPGQENKESIESGSAAAARGGFTSIACMANTEPVNDNRSVTEFIIARAKRVGLVNIFPIAAVSRGQLGENLVEMADLVEGGAVAFSDDGHCVMKADLIRKALEYANMLDVPIIEHPEDHSISAEGQVNEGFISYKYGLRGILKAAEEVIVARDLILQERIRSRLHLTHISTAGSVELIRNAHRMKTPVSADATPHHLLLNEELVQTYNTVYKVKPPLRSENDRLELIRGLQDGTIDCIASDHAPHTRDDKDKEFEFAPFGVIGLESTFAVIHDRLVRSRQLTVTRMVELLATNPARVLGLKDRGRVKAGLPADLTILNLKKRFKIEEKDFRSKANNCPFLGWEGLGTVEHTIVSGNIVYSRKDR
ncbi:MAG: dihydroorotase [Candidatus Aminicenantes bacterium]|nr:dihydroorotase [Candidatus Aminicenantes bacterium]